MVITLEIASAAFPPNTCKQRFEMSSLVRYLLACRASSSNTSASSWFPLLAVFANSSRVPNIRALLGSCCRQSVLTFSFNSFNSTFATFSKDDILCSKESSPSSLHVLCFRFEDDGWSLEEVLVPAIYTIRNEKNCSNPHGKQPCKAFNLKYL